MGFDTPCLCNCDPRDVGKATKDSLLGEDAHRKPELKDTDKYICSRNIIQGIFYIDYGASWSLLLDFKPKILNNSVFDNNLSSNILR